jgi:hypothetical protein
VKNIMMIHKAWIFTFGLILAFAMVVPNARADEWNEKTELTFTAAVEIPGIVLPAGTYWFILADSRSDRDIVQVFNQDESHLYATFIAIPTYRMAPTGKTEIKFAERPQNKPEAILKWYYPGQSVGQEFLYSRRHEREFARDGKREVWTQSEGL